MKRTLPSRRALALALGGLFLGLFASLAGCGAPEEAVPTPTPSPEPAFTVAFSGSSNDSWSWAVGRELEARCEERGWTLISYDCKGRAVSQEGQLEDILSQGEADVAVVCGVDEATLDAGVEALYRGGVKVITLDRQAGYDARRFVECHVGPDQDAAVEALAEFLEDRFPPPGPEGAPAEKIQYTFITVREDDSLPDALARRLGDPFAQVNPACLGVDRDRARAFSEGMLTWYPKLSCIVAVNDQMALGAVEAVQAAERADVPVVSCHADDEGLESVARGELSLTLDFPADAAAQALADAIDQVAQGRRLAPVKLAPEKIEA